MEQETLFTASKWNILKSLSTSKKSPLELAEQNNTSVSNVSQSLRFLELAGLVKSERISNRDKGQPRVVYSLAKDKAYIIITAEDFTNKKTVELDEHKKALLKIWMYEDETKHYFIEKAYHALTSQAETITGVYLDKTTLSQIKLAIVSKQKGKVETPKETTLKHKDNTMKIKYEEASEEKIRKEKESYYAIHDPQKLLRG